MGMLDGKSAIITGAGRGLGREEALAMAKEGCNILINDLGASFDGTGKESKVADEVVEEIKKFGVKAVANYDSVTDFDKAKAMIDQAASEFGRLDIVVNNAGILRDRMLFNMSEEEFDAVIAVHLKGTFNMTRHAAAYFREEGKKDPKLKNFGRIINTSSDAGLLGNIGQTNYGAAKAGIAAFTVIASMELKKYATVNCIVPVARTRLTTDATPKMVDIMNKLDESGFDVFNPANVAPMVIYLASDKAKRVSGEVFRVVADKVFVFQGWHSYNDISNDGKPFTPQELAKRVKSDLLKGLPRKETLMDAIGSLIKM
ncbi:MAG: SDR family NAD(P)-dependent oxidoreductase [Candidatus Lokiarchaeota archaeon]|nr:SDR family NAD(P)-dependent oxidoreductase [Candidatus Lokiarchaeota archaeon]MBD3343347.1 SDR family NAD(P)-dependent oxidoreductase [Candidatus Lokiarchaeota archaeon]